MSFLCTKCGACCRNIRGIKELESYDLGNGVCTHLDIQTNQCKIYANRPMICRVEAMYEKVFFRQYSKEEFYTLNIESCKILQEKENVDKVFRF
ncbi:YkgJ family cysteine cluster protein [Helicobacter trogontum]|uniref:YkgJ family cysteine cluster protein n=1 Tax=Helicobacter trogontum TaxID=50960 RepID=A0A4U8TIH6_9HELI|nr:YkgJ family cysteine cluster protein [Helicobacter trogontum]MDY5185489.1 YkgJ family cysteine cluster protein [Helicobacter trogontum]TLD99318.1 YkgJ family cysteine cluster protein [Helicobacter trogontum]